MIEYCWCYSLNAYSIIHRVGALYPYKDLTKRVGEIYCKHKLQLMPYATKA